VARAARPGATAAPDVGTNADSLDALLVPLLMGPRP
jgi:hypothetical protein